MRKNKTLMTLLIMMLSAVMVISMVSCGKKAEEPANEGKEKEVEEKTEESEDDKYAGLLEQVAKKDIQPSYSDYLPDEVFAVWKLLGTTEKDGEISAYVVLNTSEYVALKDKLYSMAGGRGPAIVKYTDDGELKLKEIVWSADGEAQEQWLKDNFPKDVLKKYNDYVANDDEENAKLTKAIQDKAARKMGYPIDDKYMLDVDEEKGTYEIWEAIYGEDPKTGDPTFDTKVIEKGKLEDLK